MYVFNTKSLGFHLTLLCTFFHTTRHTAQTAMQPETADTLGKSNKGFYQQHARAIHLTGAVLLLVFGSWGAYTVYRWRTFSKTEEQSKQFTVHFISVNNNDTLNTIILKGGQIPTDIERISVYKMVAGLLDDSWGEDVKEEDKKEWSFYKAFISLEKIDSPNNISEDKYLYCKTNQSVADYLRPHIGKDEIYIYVKKSESSDDLNTGMQTFTLHYDTRTDSVEAQGDEKLLDALLKKGLNTNGEHLYTAHAPIDSMNHRPAGALSVSKRKNYTVGQLLIDSGSFINRPSNDKLPDFVLSEIKENTHLHLYAYEEKTYNKLVVYTSKKQGVERWVGYVSLDKKTVKDIFGDNKGIYLSKEGQIGWPTKETFEEIINDNDKVFYVKDSKEVNIENYLKKNDDGLDEITFFLNEEEGLEI